MFCILLQIMSDKPSPCSTQKIQISGIGSFSSIAAIMLATLDWILTFRFPKILKNNWLNARFKKKLHEEFAKSLFGEIQKNKHFLGASNQRLMPLKCKPLPHLIRTKCITNSIHQYEEEKFFYTCSHHIPFMFTHFTRKYNY